MSKIYIPNPLWGSDLASIILDLEKLRTKRLRGDVPPYIFFQLKSIFHILETLGSARIEGNNTTLAEYVEEIIENKNLQNEANLEIKNLETAIEFIEEHTNESTTFDRAFISNLHQIVTKNLTPPPFGDGSLYPGELRKHSVRIKNSGHIPPTQFTLQDDFEEFVNFINAPHKEQYQLLMVAVAHHRFEYIHPFDNGNGRMGRLLNYAFLIKLGFNVKQGGRIINPSSVFYTDRNRYYGMLSQADSLADMDVLKWCEYFLLGLNSEIEKIDYLLDLKYVKSQILSPVLKFARDQEYITKKEYDVLTYLIAKNDLSMKAGELSALEMDDARERAKIIAKLREKNMIMPITKNGRIYTIQFTNNYLLRGVMKVLQNNGFVSGSLNATKINIR